MTEKVLGFKEKDASVSYAIGKDKLVPVRLKSESVSLEWLIKYCNEHGIFVINKESLIKAARKEAEK